ncbi:putative quinol monooxygenase [Psychromonas sp. 14N.309.X.WAT.B.A12]|uniref:putative quinol monooxygenase n=1 Tax=unclassified Psychromonas TaxID=2614957 RepID=UPI0025B235C5|nr:putative quinol monooxygenase [Psychromonas sp. 14N.309.X.WAT.B.A12]MDN2664503.1 putative quinol monooxygenase [Psychromonas sp. 14N.309.X.WAT.B.A12]
MPALTIIANIVVKPEHLEFVRSELLTLVEITKTETGCINYDLHQDKENPNHFIMFEKWQNRALWKKHGTADHFTAYVQAAEGKIDSFTVNEMNLLTA